MFYNLSKKSGIYSINPEIYSYNVLQFVHKIFGFKKFRIQLKYNQSEAAYTFAAACTAW